MPSPHFVIFFKADIIKGDVTFTFWINKYQATVIKKRLSKQFIYETIAHVWLGFKWVYRITHHSTFTTLIYSFLFFIKRLQKYKNAPIINKQAAFLHIAQINIYGLFPLPFRYCFMTGYPYFSAIICRFYSIIPMIFFIFA